MLLHFRIRIQQIIRKYQRRLLSTNVQFINERIINYAALLSDWGKNKTFPVDQKPCISVAHLKCPQIIRVQHNIVE